MCITNCHTTNFIYTVFIILYLPIYVQVENRYETFPYRTKPFCFVVYSSLYVVGNDYRLRTSNVITLNKIVEMNEQTRPKIRFKKRCYYSE